MKVHESIELWINNEQGLQEFMHELARSCSLHDLEDNLKDWFEELVPSDLNPIVSDVLQHAIQDCDWLALARSILEDVAEIDAYEEERSY